MPDQTACSRTISSTLEGNISEAESDVTQAARFPEMWRSQARGGHEQRVKRQGQGHGQGATAPSAKNAITAACAQDWRAIAAKRGSRGVDSRCSGKQLESLLLALLKNSSEQPSGIKELLKVPDGVANCTVERAEEGPAGLSGCGGILGTAVVGSHWRAGQAGY